MGILKGIYKRYFPDIYQRKYNNPLSKFHIEKDQDKENILFGELYNNSFDIKVLDDFRVEERYEMVFQPYGIDEWFISRKYFEQQEIDGLTTLVMIDYFLNHKGDYYRMVVGEQGEIHDIKYNIDGMKNELSFVTDGGRVIVFDAFDTFEKSYNSHYHNDIYECDNIGEKLIKLRTDCKGFVLWGYSLFNSLSNGKHYREF